MLDNKHFIAKRVAQELKDGYTVNLGGGAPRSYVPLYIPEGITVTFHTENGILGVNGQPEPGFEDNDIFDAGGEHVTIAPGAAFINSALSFGIMRGGHLDVTVLGALQVDAEGSLANWCIPGYRMIGMGGAMDLVCGAKKVIIATEHTNKGKPRIIQKCTYPLTGKRVVDLIITEMGVIKVTPNGLLLTEIASNATVDQVRAVTAAPLAVAADLKIIPRDMQ
ncbi:MAG: 3-oxoacid CoA-transferase subunit B [Oscillospiraceae bacterium]|jgi:acetate CoA/acetoacetate CoA-transferase beta subunit